MGKLDDALVEKLLQTSATHKQVAMEEVIRQLLGAQPLDGVSALPARRGRADGGIDGIIDIQQRQNQDWVACRAALNIKIRKSPFSREQLGGFLLDMDREKILVGIIITASGLAPDALSEMTRKNSDGQVKLVAIRLGDILAGSVGFPEILISGVGLATVLTNNLRRLLVDN